VRQTFDSCFATIAQEHNRVVNPGQRLRLILNLGGSLETVWIQDEIRELNIEKLSLCPLFPAQDKA